MGHRVAVVGGGLAGLFTASELLAEGVDDVVVLDRDAVPGGVARTIRRDGFSLEPAAGTLLLPHPHLTPVLDHIGAQVTPAVDAGLRYVYTRGRLVALPASPKAVLAPLVPWTAKLRGALEPFVRTAPSSEDETLAEFFRRRLGGELGRTVAWLAASGVFAGDPTRLSARSAFPLFPALEDSAGSIVGGALRRRRATPGGAGRPTSHLPVGGMTGLVERIVARLDSRHVPGFEVEEIRPSGSGWRVHGTDRVEAEHVVLAVRPADASKLVTGELGPVLAEASSAPVVVLGLGGRADRMPLPPGFGALVGPDAGTATLGVLFESSYAPDRAPEGFSLVKVIAGGARKPEVARWEDDRIVEEIGAEVARILGEEIDVSFVEIVRHDPGIPQYRVGHGRWLARIDSITGDLPGLHLTGWGYRGVGVAHLAADAAAVAAKVARS